ncbi:MAG: fibronectin type III domain-containing protein [Bacteroidota bacterium]
MATKLFLKSTFLFFFFIISSFIFGQTIPPAPSNLRFTEEKCGRLVLKWDDYPSDLIETGYEIYYSFLNGSGNYFLLGTLGANINSYTFSTSNLPNSFIPIFKIRGIFDTIKTDFSNSIHSDFVCTVPSNLQVNTGFCEKIEFYWEGNYDYYKIYVSDSGENGYFKEVANSYPYTYYGNTAAIKTTDIQEGKSYFYKVKGFVYFQTDYETVQNISGFSNAVEATNYCALPTGLKILETNCNGINLSWDAYPNNPSTTSYNIYRSDNGENGEFINIGQTSANTTTFIDNGIPRPWDNKIFPLISGKDYYYKISANYYGTNTKLSSSIVGQLACEIPKINSLFASTNICGSINLTWEDYPVEFSEIGYDVYRSTNLYPDYFIKIASLEPNITNYNDIGYGSYTSIGSKVYSFQNQDHFYKIVGRFSNLNSGFSKQATGHIGICPLPPTDLSISVNNCQNIQISWNDLPSNINETGFGIYLKRGITGSYNYIGYVNANVLSFTDTGSNGYLTGGETYSYMVKGLFNNTSTDFSEVVTATFVCESPILNSVSQQIGINGNFINWQYNPNVLLNYGIRIYRSSTGEFGNYDYVFSPYGDNNFSVNDQMELKSGKEYFYKLTGTYEKIESNFSNRIGSVFQIATPPPSNFRVTSSNCTKITLAWDNYPQNTNHTGFIIYRRAVGAFQAEDANVEIRINGAFSGNTYEDKYKLEEGIAYEYTIVGRFNYISTAESTPLSVTLNCFTPINLSQNPSSCGSINLKWNALPLNSNVKSYLIYRSDTGENGFFENIGSVEMPNLNYSDCPQTFYESHYFNLPIFESDKEYFYKVRGYLKDNYNVFDTHSKFSNVVNGSFHCSGPVNLNISEITCNAINLNWEASTEQNVPIFKYLIYRSETGINGEYEFLANSQLNNFSDTNQLVPGRNYFYKIKTQVGNVLSAFSEPFEATFICPSMCLSVKSGSWIDPTVWSCGRIPTNLDEVIINPTHVITIDENLIGIAKNLVNCGELKFGVGSNLILNSP